MSDATNCHQPELTPGQIGCVLNDIAQSAAQLDELLIRIQSSSDDGVMVDTLAGASAALAQRIGWMADMAGSRIKGSMGPVFGDAVWWMLPPTFGSIGEADRALTGGGA